LPPTCESLTSGYLVVACCLGSWVRHDAPGALRGLFFLVGMLLALRGLFFTVDMSLPVVHSAVTSPLLPSSCRVHCLCLLAFGHGPLTGIASLILVLFKRKSTPVVVPASTGLVPVVDRSVVQSACRCLLVSIVAVRSIMRRLIPVVPIAGSTGLSVLLLNSFGSLNCCFRNPADSHVLIFVAPVCTSSLFGTSFR
jgi:hypothetical protein